MACPVMEEVGEMDCPGLEEAIAMASMRDRLVEFEGKELVWNPTMEHVPYTLFQTNKELSELQSRHNHDMAKREVCTLELTSQLAQIQGELRFRTRACLQAQMACPMMLDKIKSLQAENARQAADLAELREQNERLSGVLQACELLD